MLSYKGLCGDTNIVRMIFLIALFIAMDLIFMLVVIYNENKLMIYREESHSTNIFVEIQFSLIKSETSNKNWSFFISLLFIRI